MARQEKAVQRRDVNFVVLSLVAAIATLLPVMYSRAVDSGQSAEDVAALRRSMERLRPLHTKMGKPQPGDWLARHREAGQTFAQYVASRPVTPNGKRRIIYIQPLGQFNDEQRRVVKLTAEFMGIWFNRPVRIAKDIALDVIPETARRVHPSWGMKQILSTYVLDRVLKPRLPKDAAALIAFTASDLWPGRGWNFVFGQASLRDRVGVWSIYRKRDPKDFTVTLKRTLATAVHETGHMFSISHCTAYECVMCGSNSLAESDRRPLASCPECVAKVCWATGADMAERYKRLATFCETNGLKEERTFFEKSMKALDGERLHGSE